MSEFFNYQIFDFRLQSQIELPGVPQLRGEYVDTVRVCYGTTPESLDNPQFRGFDFDASPNEFILRIPEVARYWVRNGNSITVEPDPQSPLLDVRSYLVASVFGSLLQQRGYLTLHGACLEVGVAAFCLVGNTGAGKSTMTARLAQSGYPVICDDVSPIVNGSGRDELVVLPGFNRVRLCDDAVEHLNIAGEEVARSPTKRNKHEISFRSSLQRPDRRPVPIAGIYQLEFSDSDNQIGIHDLGSREKMQTILSNTFRYMYLKGLNRAGNHLKLAVQLTEQAFVRKVVRPKNYALLDDVMEVLLADMYEFVHGNSRMTA